MVFLLSGLSLLCGLGSLVCFIMVLIKIFQNGQTGLGIACAVLALCGIGFLIAFIVGWMNSTKWNIKNVMLGWTGCWVAGIILNVLIRVVG